MQKRAFIVCGPESSGNRMLGAVLCRAGCWGSGSTRQPSVVASIPDVPLVMVIWHRHLRLRCAELRARGFVVQALLPVREWCANVGSLISRKHDANEAGAAKRILRVMASNLLDALLYDIPLIVTTYEGMTRPALVEMLRRLDLRHDNLDEPLKLPGQDTPGQTYQPNGIEENLKHYRTAQEPTPCPTPPT
jgi:hypothetical protein